MQGVWFRASTSDEARRLGLRGFVRNEPDGSVYAEVEGEENEINEFVKWCHIGSEQSSVEKVNVVEGEPQGFDNFIITD